ncbi:exosortase [Haliea sp. E1-2-M8]|uniref:exosortase n=1 Tax=Haliea sp. E1-2-M8 TaxID=3064706 RepID=UPI00271BC85F|nr:exosortase [Haliea sp. E1-2-M8]MDO8863767.1 exosortase [Haliea sp. E1-2-M8]
MQERQSMLPLLVIAGIFSLFLLFNPEIIADWRIYGFDDGTYSHAYLMPFVIGFLYWRAWRQCQLQLRWNGLFYLLFLASLLGLLWLIVAQQSLLSRFAIPLVLAFALASVFRVNASLWVPVSLVWFIVPIWGGLNGILQAISVSAVNWIMSFSHIPTFVEGNYVHIPAGTFEIADGCSGLRYLISALALAVIYAFLNLSRARSVAIFFITAILGSLLTNWLRIAALIYIGDYSDMQSDMVRDHNVFGWYLFVPFLIVLFYVGSKLEPRLPAPKPPLDASAFTGSPVKAILMVMLPLVLISGVTIHLYQYGTLRWLVPTFDVDRGVGTSIFSEPSPVVYVWSSREEENVALEGTQVSVQRYFFEGETEGHRADYYLNNPVPRGWRVTDSLQSDHYTRLLIEHAGGQKAVLVYWYEIGQRKTGSRQAFRIYRLIEAVSLNNRTALHWIFAGCGDSSCRVETEQLQRWVDRSSGAR